MRKYIIFSILVFLCIPTFVPFLTVYRSLNVGHILLLFLFFFDLFINKQRLHVNKIFIIIAIIPFIGIISLFINGLISNYTNFGEGMGYLFKWVYNAFIVFYIPRQVGVIGARSVLISILLGCLLTSIWGWYAWSLSPNDFYGIPMLHVYQNTKYIVNRNYLSFYSSIGFCISFFLALKENKKPLEKIIYIIIALFMGFTVLAGFSKGGWIAAILPITYYLSFYSMINSKKIIKRILLAPIVLMGSYIYFILIDKIYLFEMIQLRFTRSGDTISQRFTYLTDAFQLFINNFFIGVGPKLYSYSSKEAGLSGTSDPHNAWLWVGVEFGVFAVMILSGLAIYGLFNSFKFGLTDDNLLICHILIICLMFHSLTAGLSFSSPIFWIILAILVSVKEYYNKMDRIQYR